MAVAPWYPKSPPPRSKPVEVFQRNADFESEVVALLGRTGWLSYPIRFAQKGFDIEMGGPKLKNLGGVPNKINIS